MAKLGLVFIAVFCIVQVSNFFCENKFGVYFMDESNNCAILINLILLSKTFFVECL